MCSSLKYKIEMIDYENIKDQHKQQHCQGHHPGTRSSLPGHNSPPEDRESTDGIYGHQVLKRTTDSA